MMADGYTLCVVQRLFSMFPSGVPGIGLLFLRSSVAVGLLLEGPFSFPLSGWIHGAAIVLSIGLLIGYLTPVASVIGLLLHVGFRSQARELR